MSRHSDYFELVCKSVNCFTDQGDLIAAEFDRLMQIVLRDGIVDDRERGLLTAIINKAESANLSDKAREMLAEVRTQYNIALEQ